MNIISKSFKIYFLFSVFLYANISFASNAKEASLYINGLNTSIVDLLGNKKKSIKEKDSELAELFNNNIDINWISKFVLGKYARNLNESELNEYNKFYHKYLVKLYVPYLREYANYSLVIKKVTQSSSDKYYVETEMENRQKGNKLVVNYHLIKNSNKFLDFKVRDITGEGVSLVISQRSEIGAIIANSNIHNLISILKDKVGF